MSTSKGDGEQKPLVYLAQEVEQLSKQFVDVHMTASQDASASVEKKKQVRSAHDNICAASTKVTTLARASERHLAGNSRKGIQSNSIYARSPWRGRSMA